VCPSQALISAQLPLTMDTEAHIAVNTTPRYRAEEASLPEDSKYHADWKEPVVQLPVRLELVPGISGWTTDYASLEELYLETYMAQPNGTIQPTESRRRVLEFEVTYKRSSFVRFFAVMIIILLWIMSVYLLVLAVDHVLIRPRQLGHDTIAYAVGMLFALPTLRLLLDAPLGSYIDFLGFAWCLMLVAVAVIIFFSGAYSDHDHGVEAFEKHQKPQPVSITHISADSAAHLAKVLLPGSAGHLPTDGVTTSHLVKMADPECKLLVH
jgi:hypothetical protein